MRSLGLAMPGRLQDVLDSANAAAAGNGATPIDGSRPTFDVSTWAKEHETGIYVIAAGLVLLAMFAKRSRY